MKTMKLYNTLTRQIDEIKPLSGNTVKMYSCGLTVYSQPHIGNWTGYIYWDVLVRTLQAAGYTVDRTQNYTDVGHLSSDGDSGEDKMERGAKREGLTAWDIAEKYIEIAEREAYSELGLLRPNHIVRATEMIDQQISFVQALESKGYTYIIPEEGVYFDTSKLHDYGKLARLDVEGLEAGARVSVSGKRNITDFAIWKFSPSDSKRDMEWDSPWGKGFPGWHLECSVIARETLGDQIDIHTGGIDHIPVHHTNEIAQTEAVTGKQFSQMWLHNNHIKVNGTKISKSLGNIFTLDDIRNKGFSIDAFKLMILSKHYRTEGNFTWDILSASQASLKNLEAWADLQFQGLSSSNFEGTYKALIDELKNHLETDLATPQAIASINKLINLADEHGADSAAITDATKQIDELLGLHLSERTDISDSQKKQIQDREAARSSKNWSESDKLRDDLSRQGIGLRDAQSGPIWFRQ